MTPAPHHWTNNQDILHLRAWDMKWHRDGLFCGNRIHVTHRCYNVKWSLHIFTYMDRNHFSLLLPVYTYRSMFYMIWGYKCKITQVLSIISFLIVLHMLTFEVDWHYFIDTAVDKVYLYYYVYMFVRWEFCTSLNCRGLFD